MKQQLDFTYQYILHGDCTATAVDTFDNSAPDPNNTLWQHINLNQSNIQTWLLETAGLDQITVDSLSADETRPRSFSNKNGVLTVLRGVNNNPGEDVEDMISIRLWIEKNRIISIHRRQLLSITDMVSSFDENNGPRNSGEFLTTLVENLANRIGDFVNAIEEDMGQAEDDLESLEPSELRSTLGSLRRKIATVRRFLSPQRDALDRLNYIETDILSSHDRLRLREESDRISRYLEDLDLARERAVLLQESFLSLLAQEQNTRMYVLSVVAAIFLPLTFVTGLLGMNVGGLPGLENPSGFAIATVIMVVATLALIVLFKLKKWV